MYVSVCVYVCVYDGVVFHLSQLGYELASNQTSPKRVDTLYGRKIRQVCLVPSDNTSNLSHSLPLSLSLSLSPSLSLQITAGVRHCLALDTPPPARGDIMFAVPLSIPVRYPTLRDLPCKFIHARLMLLHHFAKLMVASWKLFSIQNISVSIGDLPQDVHT